MTYSRNSTVALSAGWRDRLAAIREARREYQEYENLMTHYERAVITREINARREQHEAAILAGALAEWHQAADHAAAALAKVEQAKGREAARWDAGRLAGEMQVVRMLVDSAVAGGLNDTSSKRLEQVYQDAERSGDPYKLRACGEVLAGLSVPSGDFEARRAANRLAQAGLRAAEQARAFPELDQAQQAAAEAIQGLNEAKRTLLDVDDGLGYTRPNGEIGNFTILRSIQKRVDESGPELRILPGE